MISKKGTTRSTLENCTPLPQGAAWQNVNLSVFNPGKKVHKEQVQEQIREQVLDPTQKSKKEKKKADTLEQNKNTELLSYTSAVLFQLSHTLTAVSETRDKLDHEKHNIQVNKYHLSTSSSNIRYLYLQEKGREEIYHDFRKVRIFLTFSKLLSVTSYISSALGSMPNLGFPASPKPYLKWRVKKIKL